MAMEIERKYFLDRFPAELIEQGRLKRVSTKYIEQTYLALAGKQEIRIRRITESTEQGDQVTYTHTFKNGGGMAKEEIEYEISKGIYDQLLQASGRAPLEKLRTAVLNGDILVEIDEYKQFDLITADVEFGSMEEAQSFIPPAWFGREVGGEQEYKNKTLWMSLQKAAT